MHLFHIMILWEKKGGTELMVEVRMVEWTVNSKLGREGSNIGMKLVVAWMKGWWFQWHCGKSGYSERVECLRKKWCIQTIRQVIQTMVCCKYCRERQFLGSSWCPGLDYTCRAVFFAGTVLSILWEFMFFKPPNNLRKYKLLLLSPFYTWRNGGLEADCILTMVT